MKTIVSYITVNRINTTLHWGAHSYIGEATDIIQAGPPAMVLTSDNYESRKSSLASVEEVIYVKPEAYVDSHQSIPHGINKSVGLISAIHAIISYAKEQKAACLTIYAPIKAGIDNDKLVHICTTCMTSKATKRIKDQAKEIIAYLKDDGMLIALAIASSLGNHMGARMASIMIAVADGNMSKEPVHHVDTDLGTYWKSPVVRHPLLSNKTLVNIVDEDHPSTYYCVNTKKDIYTMGRRSSDVGYSVVSLTKEIPALTLTLEHINKPVNGYKPLSLINLDRVLSPAVAHQTLKWNASTLLQSDPTRGDYYHVLDDGLCVNEARPANLVMNGVVYLGELAAVLYAYMNGDHSGLTCTDITEELYDKNPKNNRFVLKKSIKVGTREIHLSHPTNPDKKHIYLLGDSLPSRNNLNQLNNILKGIIRVVWVAPEGYKRFAHIVVTSQGHGIYQNKYSDILLTS